MVSVEQQRVFLPNESIEQAPPLREELDIIVDHDVSLQTAQHLYEESISRLSRRQFITVFSRFIPKLDQSQPLSENIPIEINRRVFLQWTTLLGVVSASIVGERIAKPIRELFITEDIRNSAILKNRAPLQEYEKNAIIPNNWVVLGDSDALGVHDGTEKLFSASDHMAEELNRQHPDKWRAPIYLAKGGSTTKDTLRQIQEYKKALKLEFDLRSALPFSGKKPAMPNMTFVVSTGINNIGIQALGSIEKVEKLQKLVQNPISPDIFVLPHFLQSVLDGNNSDSLQILREIESIPEEYGKAERICWVGIPNMSYASLENAPMLRMAAGTPKDMVQQVFESNGLVRYVVSNISVNGNWAALNAIKEFQEHPLSKHQPKVIYADSYHSLFPSHFPLGAHPSDGGQVAIGEEFLDKMRAK